MSEPAADSSLRRPASLWELFTAFNRLALQGFGGVLPIAQRELVERHRWLSPAEFTELLSIGQVLPGPNVVNLALMVGDRYFGWRGAMAAVAGMLSVPLVLVLSLAALYKGLAQNPAVAGAVRGMGLASAGLILAMALKLLPGLKRNPMPVAGWALITVLTVACVLFWHWPLAKVVLVIGGSSMALAAWCLRRQQFLRADPPNGPPNRSSSGTSHSLEGVANTAETGPLNSGKGQGPRSST